MAEQTHVKDILRIENHCFFTGPRSAVIIDDLPICLPFSLGIDEEFAIPRLQISHTIKQALDDAYKLGSMVSTPLGASSLSQLRMKEVVNRLSSTTHVPLNCANMLEIGAGSGGLMLEFKKLGASVAGVEIGPQGSQAAQKHGLRITSEHFTPELFSERFDIIYSYGCLEHLSDLSTFFSACRSCLKNFGLMFHVVPNSEIFFRSGSIGHLVHEHVNYFTPRNGVRLLEAQGFVPADFSLNAYGNELVLHGFYDASIKPHSLRAVAQEESERLKRHSDLLHVKDKLIITYLEKLLRQGHSIGFYAGGFEYGHRLKSENIRYFDGDEAKHGLCWLSGLKPIEPPNALIENPVNYLVIFKPHLFEVIKQSLRKLELRNTTILSLEDLTT